MLTCTHLDCGHSWSQYLTTPSWREKSPETEINIIDCPVCAEEAAQEDADRWDDIRQQDRDKARYYERKYGDQ